MSSNETSSGDLQIFQALQRVQCQLWRDLQPTTPDDPMEQFQRDQDYRRRLRDLEATTAAEFDVPQQHLHAVMLRGVLEGWPWRDA
jgi:hypothetical protein